MTQKITRFGVIKQIIQIKVLLYDGKVWYAYVIVFLNYPHKMFSFLKNRSGRALLLANVVPLIGVLFFHWNVFSVLLSYWLESGVIGFYNVLKMWRAEGQIWVGKNNEIETEKIEGASLLSPEKMKNLRWFLIPFFIFHYGGFMFGHFAFITAIMPSLLGSAATKSMLFSTALWPMVLTGVSLLISHCISYYENFIGREEYKLTSSPGQMFAPYKRVFVMHITIILAGILLAFTHYPPIALVVLICLKIGIDQVFHCMAHPSLGAVNLTI